MGLSIGQSQSNDESKMTQIWIVEDCVEQAMLRFLEHPEYLLLTAEEIQDQTDMPFRKDIIDLAKVKCTQLNQDARVELISTHSIATVMECVEQVKLRLGFQLPSDYDAKECHVQTRLNIPFRKVVIKTALFDLYSKSKLK